MLSSAEQSQIITAIPQDELQREYQKRDRKTVGWLVCTEGSMIGESFTLREGDNRIGRLATMDVALLYEAGVNREDHALISYDSATNGFVLSSENPSARLLCNAKTVRSSKRLKSRDVITIGNCSLVFIPFCNATFSWKTEQ
jgi:hypothetical protein